MFKFWGDGSELAKQLVQAIRVRSTENFNWTFIFILAVVFYVYWTEIHKKKLRSSFCRPGPLWRSLALRNCKRNHWSFCRLPALVCK